MAYDTRKIAVFGVAGVAFAALIILAFVPVQENVGVATSVFLQEIPGYGFQIVKMSEEQDDVTQLMVTLDGFEFRKTDGSWVETSRGSFSFDLIRDHVVSLTLEGEDLDAGSYDGVRFRVVQGLGFTNATMSSGDLVPVDSPQSKMEYTISTFEIDEAMETLRVELTRGAGVMSNYMLPDLHLAIMTTRLDFAVS